MAGSIEPVESAALALYGVLGLACGVSVLYSFKERDITRFKVQQCFHFFLASFVAVRLLWFIFKATQLGGDVVTFSLNRIGLTLYFTAFTLVLFYWVENYHKTYVSSHEFLPRFFWLFVACNAAMYAFELVIVSIFIAGNHKEEGNAIYEISIYTVVILSFVVSFTFLVYGVRLYIRHKYAQDFEENRTGLSSELNKIFLCTIAFCACFLARGVAFLYRPVYGKKMNEEAFYTIAYFIPELIPSFVEFYVIRAIKHQQRQQSQFIETLYQEEEALRESAEGPLLLDNLSLLSKTSPPLPDEKSSLLKF